MAKRKSAVNDIIYELDNEDITLSSDDEAKQPKIIRKEVNNCSDATQSDSASQDSANEIIDVDSSVDIINCDAPSPQQNGGKSLDDLIIIDDDTNKSSNEEEEVLSDSKSKSNGSEGIIDPTKEEDIDVEAVDDDTKPVAEGNKTTLYNEDIDVDSPCDSDLGVVGCENRTPLITVKFKDNKLATSYKKRLKAFMISLIKLHETENVDSDNDTDLELDIWPEDLETNVTSELEENNFFFVDTAPCDQHQFVPAYESLKDESVLSNTPAQAEEQPRVRKGPTCFNCEGDHALRDCKQPKNYAKINEMRKKLMNKRTERYHMEDDQRFGHMTPGRISGKLRDALGLKRSELPLHIYRMRVLGYPPAWLEEARISHSGISLFDSSGRATLEPDEEEGEVNEPGSKDKFDIKKIWDFPGFNMPASKRYRDESQYLNMPPMCEQDSKLAMLQVLAPNAMKAYKRKKLTYFPSAAADTSQSGQAEMEIDSGDETLDFPSAPPLPDEVPPPPPPPPKSPPPLPHGTPPLPPGSPPLPPGPPLADKTDDDDVEEVSIADMIVLDETEDAESENNSGRTSPSLDDLEVKKRALLQALNDDTAEPAADKEGSSESKTANSQDTTETQETDATQVTDMDKTTDNNETSQSTIISTDPCTQDSQDTASTSQAEPATPKAKTIRTEYGTPLVLSVTPYNKLPSDNKFAKDICDVINFENLPNSTGKYKQISTLLKKVKDEVDRIQDS